jgi:nicotinamide mononucleotide transporter
MQPGRVATGTDAPDPGYRAHVSAVRVQHRGMKRSPADPIEVFLTALRGMDWLEVIGLVSGLLCVALLIRQHIWTFPIGLIYAFVSVAVFLQQKLYADVLLSAYYVLMNAYGWYYWRVAGDRNESGGLLPSFTPRATSIGLLALVVVAIAGMGWFLSSRTDADLPYWDSATTVMSFAAMWMTARKYMENWIVWLVVDVIATGMYLIKGIELYAVLYAVYLGMAVMGWRAWRRTMTSTEPSV